jgi:hypothetical protein
MVREEKAYAIINIPYDITIIIKASILTLMFLYLSFVSINKILK